MVGYRNRMMLMLSVLIPYVVAFRSRVPHARKSIDVITKSRKLLDTKDSTFCLFPSPDVFMQTGLVSYGKFNQIDKLGPAIKSTSKYKSASVSIEMQENIQAMKIKIDKVKNKRWRSSIAFFVENNIITIIGIELSLIGRIMGLEWKGVVLLAIYMIISSILIPYIFSVVKKILGEMISNIIALVIAIKCSGIIMGKLIYYMGGFNATDRGLLFIDTVTRVMSYRNLSLAILRQTSTAGIVNVVVRFIIYELLRAYLLYILFITEQDISEKPIVGNIYWDGGSKEWKYDVRDERYSVLFKAMMEHFMKPIFDSLGDNPCVESITIAKIRNSTDITDVAEKNIVISAEDFFPGSTLSTEDVEKRLTSALNNITKSAALIERKYFPEKYLRMSIILPLIGLCLFVIGEVLKSFIDKVSITSKDKNKMKTVPLVKYLIIYSAIACVIIFATMFLIRRWDIPKLDEISKLAEKKANEIAGKSGKGDVSEFIRHVIEHLEANVPRSTVSATAVASSSK